MSRVPIPSRPGPRPQPPKARPSSGKRTVAIILAVIGGLALLACVTCGVGGWFIYDRIQRPEASRQNMHKLQVAMTEYGGEHGGEWPASVGQIEDKIGGEAALE